MKKQKADMWFKPDLDSSQTSSFLKEKEKGKFIFGLTKGGLFSNKGWFVLVKLLLD
jgi:hypothetical protein